MRRAPSLRTQPPLRTLVLSVVTVSLVAGIWGGVAADGPADGPTFASQLAAMAFGVGGDPCPGAAATRAYDVVALQIPVVYDHWGDFDPFGRIFVLAEDEMTVRTEVAAQLAAAGQASAARALANPTGALQELGYIFPTQVNGVPNLDSIGVHPLVKPLILRARLGECVTLNLTNQLPEAVSLHVHRAPMRAGDGTVLGHEDPDVALPGTTRSFTVYLPPIPGMEGAHYLHSHADARYQTKHGLFGALVAEPADASWTSPSGAPMENGEEAIITRPGAPDFREYVIILHDETDLVDNAMRPLPILSPYGEYGPGTKSVNLRTEPFFDRFKAHDRLGPEGTGVLDRGHDKSHGYSSYTYGDPALFIPRAYVGDPTKFRLINAGDQHHVFHLHGGGDRWRNSPVSDDTQFASGLMKVNPIVRAKSERIDVQSIGPGESYNAEIEGGAGGVQQSVGDFLWHCHIVEHYVAGMWGFWRVHNTLQQGLAELPDRLGVLQAAVESQELIGLVLPNGTVLTAANLLDWVRTLLPSAGAPGPDDASVWDWTTEATPTGPRVLGEPETEFAWANYESDAPGQRPPVLFDPITKRPEFPMLRPHLGARPPFAPGHGPAPYLHTETDPNHPDGLAPPGSRPIWYNVTALSVAVPYNDDGDVDAQGQVFAHAEDVPDLVAGIAPARNLVLRANVGDSVNIILTSALHEPVGGHSKVNMHIHLVQFDVQASDGVITGFNYEQSVRPAATTGTGLAIAGSPGDATVTVTNGAALRPGTWIGVGLTRANIELRRVDSVSGDVVTLDAPLQKSHAAGERVGPEFVRYQWYADVELGTVYWHDHVDGLNSWRHGLFGALIVEPRGSTWTDPATGAPLRSGPVADIVGPDDAFREIVLEFQDRSADMDGRHLASFGLRSEPFDRRTDGNPLSSAGNGDPGTPMLRAYPGDPVMVRLLYGANANTKAVGTFAVTGHRFPYEPYNPGSRLLDAVSFGISAQHNLRLDCGAGGCANLPGDYLYQMTQPELLRRGAWGILRVHDGPEPDLLPLTGIGYGAPGTLPTGPVRHYDVTALETEVTFNAEYGIVHTTRVFVPNDMVADVLADVTEPHPLVIRALPGETVEVTLTNALDDPVTLHAGLVLADPLGGLGIPVGHNPDPTVPPGGTRTFTWFADKEVGAAYLTSYGRPDRDAQDGLYGALVIEPAGSGFAPATGMSASLFLADGSTADEHVLLYSSEDSAFEASVMPYTLDVKGIVSMNYRSEPLVERLGGKQGPFTSSGDEIGATGVHTCQLNTETCNSGVGKELRAEARNPVNTLLFSSLVFGDPATPVLSATAGAPLVIRALGGAGDQLQVHALAGHVWAKDRDMAGSQIVDAMTVGAREVANAWTVAGPGGPGDYLYGSHRLAFQEAGAWGIVRVSSDASP